MARSEALERPAPPTRIGFGGKPLTADQKLLDAPDECRRAGYGVAVTHFPALASTDQPAAANDTNCH